MVDTQLRDRDISDSRVLDAMARVPRELFLPAELRARAYEDAALSIGEGQTMSQPYMVARICAELALHGGEHVLDVGTGPGTRRLCSRSSPLRSTRSSGSPRSPEERERASSRPGTSACGCMSATARAGFPTARRSTGSPSPLRHAACRRPFTTSSSHEGGS